MSGRGLLKERIDMWRREAPLVTFSGPEAAGKSNQMKRVRVRLVKKFGEEAVNQNFIFSKEPGGSPLGELLRQEVILQEAFTALSGEAQAEVFLQAAKDLHKNVIWPARMANRLAIVDRGWPDRFAYQCRGNQNPLPIKRFWHEWKKMPQTHPDPMLILYVPYEAAQKRIRERKSKPVTNFELLPRDFHERVLEGLIEWSRMPRFKDKCVLIDVDKPKEEVTDLIYGILERRFPEYF